MAKEKFIRGKKDDAQHDGRASNVRREQEADFALHDYLQLMEPNVEYEVGDSKTHDNRKNIHINNHEAQRQQSSTRRK